MTMKTSKLLLEKKSKETSGRENYNISFRKSNFKKSDREEKPKFVNSQQEQKFPAFPAERKSI